MSGLLNAFGLGCSNDCDDNFIWVLILILLFCGNSFGCGNCNDNCGLFGGDNIWLLVIVLLLFSGNNNCLCGCDNDCCECNTCTCDDNTINC